MTFLSSVFTRYKIRSADALVAWATKQIAAKNKLEGTKDEVHDDLTLKLARVDDGRWLVDCDCGAGNAAHPEWGIAACPSCGAIHRNVSFPTDRREIEGVLSVRPKTMERFWYPSETVAQLKDENLKHGMEEK